MMRKRKLKTSRASLKIQKSIQRRENLREKMLILKLSRLRSRSWRRGLTTRKSHYWRKNLYTRKSPIWLRSSELKPLMVERVPSRLPKRSTSIRLEQLSSQGRCLPQFQSFPCSNPRLSSSRSPWRGSASYSTPPSTHLNTRLSTVSSLVSPAPGPNRPPFFCSYLFFKEFLEPVDPALGPGRREVVAVDTA